MRAIWLGLVVIAAQGCEPLDSVPIQPSLQAFGDCGAVAMANVKDAAADDYNAIMQDVVFKTSYQACEEAKARAGAAKQPGQ
jgi:hypothetical protein